MTQDNFEIKYVTGTYVEFPDSHQTRIIGAFAASSSVAEAYCRQLMEVLGIKEKEWPIEHESN